MRYEWGCENFIDKYGLVVLNEGRPARFQVGSVNASCVDLTIVSAEIASCEWNVLDQNSIGSDHF